MRHWIHKTPMTPSTIEHGKTATLQVDFHTQEARERFARELLQGGANRDLSTLRAQIHTSVGYTENVVPRKEFLEELKTFLQDGLEGNSTS